MKKMKNYLKIYGVIGTIKLIINLIKTKIFFKKARLIRFPIDIRGKKFIEINKGFTAGCGCRIEAYPLDGKSKSIFFGKNVQINDYVHITGIKNVHIGNNVLIASKVYISDAIHGSYLGDEDDTNPIEVSKDRKLTYKEVRICDNVWIGENVSILPGVKINSGSIIGANSVVTKEVFENTIVAGNPATEIKKYDKKIKKWIKKES